MNANTTQETRKCFYEPGKLYIVDIITNGKSHINKESLTDVRKRYPKAEVYDFEKAVKEIDESAHKTLKVGQVTEITEEIYYEMFECLPPVRYTNTNDGTTFLMSELTWGNITAAYIKKGGKYYTVNAYTSASHDELLNMVKD